MQKFLYSKQTQSKSKIVTVQVAGQKLQDILKSGKSSETSAGKFSLQEITGAEKPVCEANVQNAAAFFQTKRALMICAIQVVFT